MPSKRQPALSRIIAANPWLSHCAVCKPLTLMRILTVLPLLFSKSSTVGYRCDVCGSEKNVIIQ